MNLRFNIRLNTGKVEVLNIDADRVLIGSGAHCDIRLNVDQARIEHVRIDVVPQGVYATAMSFEPPPTINGVQFTQAPLPPDAILGVGQTQLQVQPMQGGGPVTKQQKKKSSPLLLGSFALIGVAVLASVFLDSGGANRNVTREAPDLWPSAPPTCPHAERAIAHNFATETLKTAESKRDRRAFYPQDGVQAVLDFELASACYRAAGEPQHAAYCDEAARSVRAEMSQEFRKFRERLRYHYMHEEWAAARYDVKNLLAFTENMQGEYREFLKTMDRDISMRGGGQKQ